MRINPSLYKVHKTDLVSTKTLVFLNSKIFFEDILLFLREYLQQQYKRKKYGMIPAMCIIPIGPLFT